MRLCSEMKNDVDRVEFRLKNKALSEIYVGSGSVGHGRITFDWCVDTKGVQFHTPLSANAGSAGCEWSIGDAPERLFRNA